MSGVQIYLLSGNTLSIPSLQKAGESQTKDESVFGIKKALLEIEYDKVGGKENYDIITAVQKKTITDPNNPQNIEAYKKYLGMDGKTEGNQGTQEQPKPTTKTDKEAVQKVIDTAVLEGNKDADIVVVEYSDTECPFCMKQYSVNKIREKLLEKYPNQIAFAFKNHRGVNHRGTEVKALAMLCAKKLGGDEAYIKMYNGIMKESVGGAVYEVARLPDLAKEIGLDVEKWQTCVDGKEMLSQFQAETKEGQSFGLTGTPGTLIINKKTGKYDTVSGAYPFETFVQKIEALK